LAIPGTILAPTAGHPDRLAVPGRPDLCAGRGVPPTSATASAGRSYCSEQRVRRP
jgi:hypothetical protein